MSERILSPIEFQLLRRHEKSATALAGKALGAAGRGLQGLAGKAMGGAGNLAAKSPAAAKAMAGAKNFSGAFAAGKAVNSGAASALPSMASSSLVPRMGRLGEHVGRNWAGYRNMGLAAGGIGAANEAHTQLSAKPEAAARGAATAINTMGQGLNQMSFWQLLSMLFQGGRNNFMGQAHEYANQASPRIGKYLTPIGE